MLKPVRAVSLLAAAALAAGTFGAHAQTAVGRGRALFEQKGCTQCHAFEARNLGPSARDMKAKLKGSPEKASAALLAAFGHADDLKSTPRDDVRALAEWLAGSAVEAPVAAPQAVDTVAARREAAAQAKRDAAARAQAEAAAKAQAKRDAAAAAKAEADARAQAKRDAADIAKREAEARARKDSAAVEAIRREAEAQAKRDAEAKAKADAVATQQREAGERGKREAEAKAKNDADALAAQKRDAEAQAQAKRDADGKARTESAATVAKAEPTTSESRKKIAYRDGSDLPPCAAPTGAPLGSVDEEKAKSIIDRVGCPQCHAYVQKKTGPPMKKIYEKYKDDWECVVFRLKKNRTHNDEGVTQDIKGNEFKIVADYIATRGK